MKLAGIALASSLCAACAGPVISSEHARSVLVPPAAVAAGGDATSDTRPPQPQSLPVPARIALAFVPEGGAVGTSAEHTAMWATGPLPEAFKAQVLEGLAEAFRGDPAIGHIEVVPSFYLSGRTATEIVASVRATFDVDAVALVTYDMQHFNRVNGWSLTYILLVPYFFVPGNQIDSQLYLDAAVYWAQNGALLFRAAGSAGATESYAPPYYDDHVQLVTESCFAAARSDLVPRLRKALAEFSKQVRAEPRSR